MPNRSSHYNDIGPCIQPLRPTSFPNVEHPERPALPAALRPSMPRDRSPFSPQPEP